VKRNGPYSSRRERSSRNKRLRLEIPATRVLVGALSLSLLISHLSPAAPLRPFAYANGSHFLPHSIGGGAKPPLSLSPFSSSCVPAARRHAARHGLLSEVLWGLPEGQPGQLRGQWRLGLSPWPPLPLPRLPRWPWEPPKGICLPGDQGRGGGQLEGRPTQGVGVRITARVH